MGINKKKYKLLPDMVNREYYVNNNAGVIFNNRFVRNGDYYD